MSELDRRMFLASTAAVALAGRAPRAYAAVPAGDDLLSYADPILRPEPLVLAESQNALPLLERAGETLVVDIPDGEYELEDCFSPDKPDEDRDRRVAAWLEAHRDAIPLAEAAAGRAGLEYPHLALSGTEFEHLSKDRRLARLLVLEAQRQMGLGNFARAAKLALLLERVARLKRDAGRMVVDYLVASACESCALALAQRIALHPTVPPEVLRDMLTRLPQRSNSFVGLRRAIRAEYCFYFLPSLDKLRAARPESFFQTLLDWRLAELDAAANREWENRCRRLAALFDGHPCPFDAVDTAQRASVYYAASLRSLDGSGELDDSESWHGPLAAWPEALELYRSEHRASELSDAAPARAREQLLRVKNPIGRKLLEHNALGAGVYRQIALVTQAAYDGTRLVLAARIFALEQGELPADLEELVEAGLMGALPTDPFTGRFYVYSPEQRTAWSVGPHGDVSLEASADDTPYYEALLWRLG
ncbi:MAG: hypothetical protein DWQ37_06785 [Planctomycetota bacterium]|nr:MAG: hypothetical protein DWQ37_06785 [Planctomycetota bacterium]